MASEIRVDKINSLSGVGTVTLSPTGVDIAGITTAATLRATTGIVTSLTAGSLTSLGAVSGTTGTFTGDVSIAENIVHTGDTDTKLVFGTDTINLNTAGSERLRITSAGLIGVGQATPRQKLHINASDSGAANMVFTNTTTGTAAADGFIVGISGGEDAQLNMQESANLKFSTADTERLRIEPTGNVKVSQNLSVTGIATVGSAVTISESGIEASGIGITCANLNGGQLGGRRNLIINGAMNVAQRGTSSTTSGYGSVDRFGVINTGTDESPTHSQVDVASGTTPYSLGFRKALKVTNGNQTGGTGTTDYISMRYKFEAQDIASSGWNYTSSSSFVTLSFWCKSSVAQNFYGYFYSHDGTAQAYAFETGSLTADTWTKVVLKIPGNSNLQFDNNNDNGLDLYISQFWGTDRTDGGKTLNSWASYNGASRTPDFTSTWYTTNDATFELTGVQFEVGSQATAFEHRTFGDELQLCQRYYQQYDDSSNPGSYVWGIAFGGGGNSAGLVIYYPTIMRANPTASGENLNNLNFNDGSAAYSAANNTYSFSAYEYVVKVTSTSLGSMTGKAIQVYSNSVTNTKIKIDAEL